VIAGRARGRSLTAPASGTRPLGDRVKETLFAILEPELRGQPFLDLFAGSGAGGIEALSRGASAAVFVDSAAAACRTIESNLAATGLAGPTVQVVRADAIAWLDGPAPASAFAAILIDPPYDRTDLLEAALSRVAAAGPDRLLARAGVVVAKHFWRQPPPARIGLLGSVRERRFGETGLTFLRWQATEGT
jgi:16S rRNA (guanine966-N2)-methyltransferase